MSLISLLQTCSMALNNCTPFSFLKFSKLNFSCEIPDLLPEILKFPGRFLVKFFDRKASMDKYRISHSYFLDKVCPDFYFYISSGCKSPVLVDYFSYLVRYGKTQSEFHLSTLFLCKKTFSQV